MNISECVLKDEEIAVFKLRSLYRNYGFLPYKMSKFEEYELYARNKDFLVSDNIITFTDTDGKLMALKPDVTLSIIKNTKDDYSGVKKVCYNENVYRVAKSSQSYREIMQVGLECIGNIDDYNIYEVLMLAAESLSQISEDYMLDISHLGILSSAIDSLSVSPEIEKSILKCVGEKNIPELCSILSSCGKNSDILKNLISNYGAAEKVIPVLKELSIPGAENDIETLEKIVSILKRNGYGEKINIDFSVINDIGYYNGFVFKGFINGIASSVLSGGQYDKLMKKMGRNSRAVGFAVYLDTLERLEKFGTDYDVDTILLYEDGCELSALSDAVKLLSENGKSVMVQKSVPKDIRHRQVLKFRERGVEIVENNA